MSESFRHNPNTSNTKLNNKGKAVVAGAALIGIVGSGAVIKNGADAVNDWFDKREQHNAMTRNLQKPDALKRYLAGTAFVGDNREKVVLVEADDFMPPDTFAKILKKDNDSQDDLKRQIMPQADGQGDPGVQPGEQFVLERDLLSDEALQTYVVRNPGEEQ